MTIGTISHGTLRTQDLIPTFLDAVRDLAPCAAPFGPIPSYAQEDDSADWWDSEDAGCLLEELTDILSDHAPAFCYFGPHEGDGSDFGFWIDPDLIDEAEAEDELLRVADLDDVPENWTGFHEGDGFSGYVLHVNDHGNATLYDGEGFELWGAV
ncbi:hypothetical protein [Halochromatium salexigens]|uniref:hypothetical protein n=1 Tax=Halochromatium salexigens TaxID=49447 RepID=UPI001912F9CC|nr:hypothetical protein [Halochromatium salexigens]